MIDNSWNSSESLPVLTQGMHNLHFRNLNNGIQKLPIVTKNMCFILSVLVQRLILHESICELSYH